MKWFSLTYRVNRHRNKKDEEGQEVGSDRQEITATTPFLAYKCADCGDLVTIHSVEDVFASTASQRSGENERLYCNDCDD